MQVFVTNYCRPSPMHSHLDPLPGEGVLKPAVDRIMLMERATDFRRLRAPQGDGQTLVDPAWPTLPQVVAQNREQLANFQYDVQGKSLHELSVSARQSLAQFAVAYTSQYRGVPERWQDPETLAGAPYILSGHQPEMFHPGVWYKNFVLGRLARQTGGVAIHLLIDSDMCRTASIRVPTGSVEQPRVEAVPYDLPGAEVPYEERTIRDIATLSTFAERASARLRPFVAEPMLASLWPLTMHAMRGRQISVCGSRKGGMRSRKLGTTRRWSCRKARCASCRSLRGSWRTCWHICRGFGQLTTMRLLCIAGRIGCETGLNQCLIWRRRRNGSEAPFWIWTAEDPERRPLFARQTGSEIILSDRRDQTIRLPLTQDGDAGAAAEQIAALSSRGIKLRTRALSTTLFARLVLSDMFLHGIGGAKYDQVTDQIIRLFFGCEAPVFATVSATLRLPIEHDSQEAAGVGQWDQRLRELRYHPEEFVDVNGSVNGGARGISEIIATKQQWLQTLKTPENARERHLAIGAANEALQPYVAPLRERIEREQKDVQQQRRREAILNSREYSFCLYPHEHFDRLVEGRRES